MTRPPVVARVARVGLLFGAAVTFAVLVATVGAACVRARVRPLDGVEGAVLFEASRIRERLPLYVDPAVGAHEYGAVPSRYYVLYPPVYSGLLSLAPEGLAAALGRWLSFVAFWGTLGFVAARARRPCRTQAILAAAFVGGVYEIAEFGASARPDALALLFAGLAAERAVRRGELDLLSGGLFALGAWTKPNVLGMAAGVFAVCILGRRRGTLAGIGGALGVSAAVVVSLHLASGGLWLTHLTHATGQPMSLLVFLAQVNHRAQFFAGLFAFAAWTGWSAMRRADADLRRRVALGLAALGASVVWCLVTLPKIGSAANYWMEPSLAAVILLAQAPPVPQGLVLGLLVPLQVLWTDVASVRSIAESARADAAHRDLLAHARAICGAGPGEIVVADEPGIEVELDGRLIAHPFPLTHAALAGTFPLGPWLADLSCPQIACVVVSHDHIERPVSLADANYDYFALPVRDLLNRRFEKVAQSWGWAVYARRQPTAP